METGKSTRFTGEEKPLNFLIAAIGASAGGVQALQEFFRQVPVDSGISYVVILHLSPDYDSQLASILQRETQLPVTQVTQKAYIEPDHIYVVPPNRHLIMQDGFIAVSDNTLIEERRAPVDIFFRTLAEEHGPRAVAVILSGTGANGSMGLKRVKEQGGVCFVQNPREAEFNEMPRNAIATELVDEVLNVAAIPGKIVAYKTSLETVEITDDVEKRPEEQQQALREIFTQLRIRTGHDFSNYKRPTLLRRIERRINIRTLPDLTAYARFLQDHPDEPVALLKDLLISVTNFFRDKKAFEMIEQEILPAIFKDKTSEGEVRVWVAGCATGEEAYSIAMLCVERTLGAIDAPKVQIFATDIDEQAIAHAREGLYSLNDAADVPPERLRRFFNKEGDCYRVRREIRETILFATHNFLKDPPFSHLDMVTCRNVMIYLNGVAQERVIETFHFALDPGGYLFLGSSESVDGASDLYAVYNRENHIYQSRQVKPKTYPIPESTPALYFDRFKEDRNSKEAERKILERISFGDLHQQLLEEYASPSLVVNEEYEILHLTERAGKYLQISGGELSQNLLKLVKPELRLELRAALYQAVQRQSAVEARELKVVVGGKTETVNIHIRPVLRSGDMAKGFILVLFEPTADSGNHQVLLSSDEPMARQLEEELLRMKAQLRAANEQHDFQAEEMKASNEELQAMNEELRSAAEELETSKEELQSINEELRTVNQELKVKIEETSIASNNLQNLINSTDIGTIFLDRSFRVVLYTPAAGAIFNLIPADHGRPLTDITHRLEYEDFLADAETVLEKLNTIEKEVRTREGRTYLMRLTPYRTDEDRIRGVVITFVDVTERRAADKALRKSEERFRAFVTASSDVIYRISADWSEMFNLKGMEFLEDTPDPSHNWLQKYIPEKEQPRVHAAISEAVRSKTLFSLDHQVYNVHGTISWVQSRAVPTLNEQGEIVEWFGAASDITARIEAEKHTHETEEKYRLQLEQQVEKRTAELKESNALLRSIYDTSLYGMSVMQAVRNEGGEIENFRIVIVNKELERETGHTDLIGKLYTVEYPGVKEAGIYNLMLQTMETGEPTGMEYFYNHEGFNKWYACQFVKLGDGLVATNLDITDRKKAEEESIAKQNLLSATMDSSLEMVQVFETVRDEGGTIVDFRWILNNHASEKVYGDVIGKSLLTLNPGVVEESIFDTFKQVVETGQPVVVERHYVHEQFNGWFYQSAVKLGDGLVTTTVDITERKEAEQKIVEEQRRLKEAQSIGAIGSFEWNFGEEGVTWSDEMYRINEMEPQSSPITVDFTESLILPEDLPAVLDLKESSFATPGHYEMQHRIQLRSGTLKWVSHRFESLADEAGNVVRIHGTLQDITRQKSAEQELLRMKEKLAQQATKKYLELFRSIDQGFCTLTVKYDENDRPVDYRFIEVSPSFEYQTGIKDAAGKWMKNIAPEEDAFWFEAYGRVARDRKSDRFEYFSAPLRRWWSVYAFPIDEPGSKRIGVLLDDITERKRRESNLAFLAEVSQDLARLTKVEETMNTLGDKIAAYLGLSACAFAEINEAEVGIIRYEWHRNDMPSLAGTYQMKDFVSRDILQSCRMGEALVIHDVFTDPRTDGAQYAALNIRSFLSIPLVRDGECRFLLVVYRTEPSDWRSDEIELIGELVNRIWTRLEKAKAEKALQQSEEKYRTLFNTIDEGFITIELIYDEAGEATDYRFIETNPAFERQTGLKDVLNKTGKSLGLNTESYWLKEYDHVVKSGESVRFENYHEVTGRWYDTYASRVGNKGTHRLITMFNDITERKQREEQQEYLLKLNDAIRSIENAEAIEEAATKTALDYFKADRCYYCTIEEDVVFVKRDAFRSDLSSASGIYPLHSFPLFKKAIDEGRPLIIHNAHTAEILDEELRKIVIGLQIISYILLPIVKNGKTIGLFCLVQSNPRSWTETEVRLAEETAERTWAAVERARAEEALQKSEQRLQRMVNIPKVGVLTFDYKDTMLYANDAFLEMVGYTREESKERRFSWRDFTPAEHLEASLKVIEQLEKTGVGGPYEKEYFRKDGSKVWMMFVAADLCDGTLVEYAIDISDRKKAEAALRQFAERLEQQVAQRTEDLKNSAEALQKNLTILQQAENLAQMGSWEYHFVTKTFIWSTGMYDLFGLSPQTEVEPEVYIQSAVSEHKGLAGQLSKKIRSGSLPLPDTICINVNGAVRVLKIEATIAKDAAGKGTKMIGVDMDITGPTQSAKTLNEQAHFIKSINKALPDILFVMNLHTKEITYINHSFQERLGFEAGQTEAGKNILSLVYEEDLPVMLTHFEELKTAADGEVCEVEYRIRAADGSLHWFRDRNAVFRRNKEGMPVEKIGIAQNVTERKKVEQELKATNISLQYANENLQQFASIASHDLQEPLRKIKMFTSVLKKNWSDVVPQAGKEVIEKIKAASDRMSQLIREVLEYSRIAYGAKEFATADLHAILQNVMGDLDLLFEETGATVAYPQPLPVIAAIPLQMHQLFYNLMTNALKFRKEGVPPVIRISLAPVTAEELQQYWELVKGKQYIVINFSDNGIGFDLQFSEQIFQIFERLHSTEEFEGTGVGLALCKKIVENHHGHIFAVAKEGEGASFYVLLPVTQ